MKDAGVKGEVEIGDFVVILDKDTRKKHAGTCDKSYKNQKRLEVVSPYGDADYFDIDLGNNAVLLANLGQNPLPGSVYGCAVRKLHSRTTHSFWGDISIMRSMDDDEKRVLKKSLTNGFACLEKIGCKDAIHLDNLLVMDAKGKYAGWYKQDKRGFHICLHPKEFDEAQASYIINHELAHAIWYQLTGDEAKSEWVKLYTEHVELVKSPDDMVGEVIDIVSAQSRHLDEYHEMLMDSEFGNEILNKLCWALMDIHLLDEQDLSLFLWSLSNKERRRSLERAVPNMAMLSGEVSGSFPVSEYAGKNTREFFAEAYAHYISHPTNVPSDVEELLRRTIPKIKKLKGAM